MKAQKYEELKARMVKGGADAQLAKRELEQEMRPGLLAVYRVVGETLGTRHAVSAVIHEAAHKAVRVAMGNPGKVGAVEIETEFGSIPQPFNVSAAFSPNTVRGRLGLKLDRFIDERLGGDENIELKDLKKRRFRLG